ncbi:MAG TPA: winged helix DNA-binding domain-containing protein [Cyclobacteriaceae bacterium]
MMTKEVLGTRLHLQGLDTPGFETAAEMVRHFGAVQAQDFFGSLWAVGQRVKNATEQSVEAALNDGSIVRSWPMRGTIHYTAPEDLRWMLDLLAERAIAKSAPYQLNVGLTKNDFTKSRKILEKELQGKRIVDRNELYEILQRKKIDTGNTRGLHIIGQLAREKVLCFGPRKGKQPTFVLLDEWIPATKALSRDEALAGLSSMYFKSHGPATVHDFAWWSGLTITEASRGMEMMGKIDFDQPVKNKKPVVNLLPCYDEFLVAYKAREDMRIIFSPTIALNGQPVGTWKRTITKKGVSIKTKLSEKISKQANSVLQKQLDRYADFIGYIRL